MRLNKFIAQSGVCSRRKADELIVMGKVKMNGKIVKAMGVQVDPQKDTITVNGKCLNVTQAFTYVMFHKPTGYTTTKSDIHAEKTIYDLLPPELHHLNPVGRLDRDSEGLLILTDDGDFLYEMTHPKHEHQKTYRIKLSRPPLPFHLKQLEKGIIIKEDEGPYSTRPCTIKTTKEPKLLEITLHEGRKRQIRKMFQQVGYRVVYLKRLSMGPYCLGLLEKGAWKTVEKRSMGK